MYKKLQRWNIHIWRLKIYNIADLQKFLKGVSSDMDPAEIRFIRKEWGKEIFLKNPPVPHAESPL